MVWADVCPEFLRIFPRDETSKNVRETDGYNSSSHSSRCDYWRSIMICSFL